MKNGDSFHNGSENIELQQRIREEAGLTPLQTDEDASPTPTAPPSDESHPAEAGGSLESVKNPHAVPAAKPVGNIYAKGASGTYSRPVGNMYAPDGGGKSATGTPRPNPYADPRVEDHTPPHMRPYVSIYARGNGVTYTAGAEKPSEASARAAVQPSAERSYVDLYARRTALRTEPTEPGVYSNTPDMSVGVPYYGESDPFPSQSAQKSNYNTPAAVSPSQAYTSEDFPNEDAERAHKGKFNMAAFILGIASFAGNMVCLTCLTPITAILAIIFGCVGRINGKFEQKGLIGMVLGIVYCGLTLLLLLFFLLVGLMTAGEMGEPV
jgi:hypothetical protein